MLRFMGWQRVGHDLVTEQKEDRIKYACTVKEETSEINHLNFHHRKLEKQEQFKFKVRERNNKKLEQKSMKLK